MKIIGNTCRVVLKADERSVTGILVDSDEHYDYVQSERSVFIIPRPNVLFYETDQLPKQSRVISAEQDKTVSVVIDDVTVTELRVPKSTNSNELMRQAYLCEPVQRALIGKKQKVLECFDDAIIIRTSPKFEDATTFTPGSSNPVDHYLSAGEMATRLSGIRTKNEP
jgi:hypothetical protein